jgi:prevent-host-death family protein
VIRDVLDQRLDLVYYLVMSVIAVNVHEAKTHLSKLLEQAMAGEEVVIMRAGRHLVRLTPVEAAPQRRKLGSAVGELVVPEEFNDALPDHVLAEFES